MPLDAVVIDERTWQRGSEAQQVEWEAILRGLRSKAVTSLEPEATLRVGVAEQGFRLEFQTTDGRTIGTVPIAHELLADHITDYIDTVRQIAEADGFNQMEALDMAKKVTHDRASRVLKKELRDFGFDLETSRRLFSLLVSLRVDTTRLTGIHGHRTLR